METNNYITLFNLIAYTLCSYIIIAHKKGIRLTIIYVSMALFMAYQLNINHYTGLSVIIIYNIIICLNSIMFIYNYNKNKIKNSNAVK